MWLTGLSGRCTLRHATGRLLMFLTLYRVVSSCAVLSFNPFGREERAACRDEPARSLHYPCRFFCQTMKLTEQTITALMSINGGWNSEVLELIGVGWPPVRGWRKRIDGTEIPDETYNRALVIKDSHLKPKTIERLSNISEHKQSLNTLPSRVSKPSR